MTGFPATIEMGGEMGGEMGAPAEPMTGRTPLTVNFMKLAQTIKPIRAPTAKNYRPAARLWLFDPLALVLSRDP